MTRKDVERTLAPLAALTPYPARDGDCLASSREVAEALSDGRVVTVLGYGQFLGAPVVLWVHRAVIVGVGDETLVVDLTASQFSPKLPRLLIASVDDYCAAMVEHTGAEAVALAEET